MPPQLSVIILCLVLSALRISADALTNIHNTKRNLGRHYLHFLKEPSKTYYAIHKHQLSVDGGWYRFRFNHVNQSANTKFHFTTHDLTIITITDCFCEGDGFTVYDNRLEILDAHSNCGVKNTTECRYFQRNPEYCLKSHHFCSRSGFLLPGFHDLVVRTMNSPYLAGTAFIKLERVCTLIGSLVPCCQSDMSCSKKIHFV